MIYIIVLIKIIIVFKRIENIAVIGISVNIRNTYDVVVKKIIKRIKIFPERVCNKTCLLYTSPSPRD